MGSVSGKVALITGGANGIGAEVARRLHAKGASLVLTDLDDTRLADLARRLGEDRVHTVVADVRDLSAMQAAVGAGLERFGGIDVAVANAGIGSFGSVLQTDPEAFKRVIDIDVVGVFHTVRAALPAIIDRRGYVLVVSSLAAFIPCPGFASYGASKAAVEHFANALRIEVAHRDVAVGSAHMSWIETPMLQDAKVDLAAFREMLTRMPGPLKKVTTVDECAAAFVKGIEARRSRVYSPAWVGLGRWLRPLLAIPIGERAQRGFIPELLPRIDAQTAALGRSTSARSDALEKK